MALMKNDIADSIYYNTDFPKKDCLKVVENFFDIIKEELIKGNEVMISGFGKWSVRKKGNRNVRNPQTGERMTIDARQVVTFKGAEKLRSEINHGSHNSKGGQIWILRRS